MTALPHEFVAAHYGLRARDYLGSAVHAVGPDLDQIEEIARGRPDARALDLGCGGGHVAYRVAPHVASVVACDVTAAMLDIVAATAAERGLGNVSVAEGAAGALPFADASFDLVLTRFSAHHWPDLAAGLREARRVLAPGGLAVVVDTVAPADPTLDTHLQAIELLRDVSHVRNHTLGALVSAAGEARFAVDAIALRPLRMAFAAWIARTRASAAHVAAIRSLLAGAPDAVRAHFRVDPDGSFDLEAATLVLRPV